DGMLGKVGPPLSISEPPERPSVSAAIRSRGSGYEVRVPGLSCGERDGRPVHGRGRRLHRGEPVLRRGPPPARSPPRRRGLPPIETATTKHRGAANQGAQAM